jgi:hypothetical protein
MDILHSVYFTGDNDFPNTFGSAALGISDFCILVVRMYFSDGLAGSTYLQNRYFNVWAESQLETPFKVGFEKGVEILKT